MAKVCVEEECLATGSKAGYYQTQPQVFPDSNTRSKHRLVFTSSSNSRPYSGVHFIKDEGLVLQVDRYDPGHLRKSPSGDEEHIPTVQMGQDVVIPFQLTITRDDRGGEVGLLLNMRQIENSIKVWTYSTCTNVLYICV